MALIRVKNSGNSGDLVANLAGLQHIYKTTGLKSVIMQRIDMPIFYYEGAKHPVVNDKGEQVSMSRKQWDMLSPLLLSQEYIDHVEEYEGQKWDFDLDKPSSEALRLKPLSPLHFWNTMYSPQLLCDLSQPWLHVAKVEESSKGKWEAAKDKIIINRTERYTNPYIEYFFLKKYEKDLIFAGTLEEYEIFYEQWKLEIPYLVVNNFLELTMAINSCRFFVGNQSFCYHLSEATKQKRILEISIHFPNCWPQGKSGYPFIYQESLQFLFKKLYNERKES